jgi:hypothetical protein
LQWTAHFRGQWAFLEALEYLGGLSVPIAVVSASPNRVTVS